jgi:hypothetical protein
MVRLRAAAKFGGDGACYHRSGRGRGRAACVPIFDPDLYRRLSQIPSAGRKLNTSFRTVNIPSQKISARVAFACVGDLARTHPDDPRCDAHDARVERPARDARKHDCEYLRCYSEIFPRATRSGGAARRRRAGPARPLPRAPRAAPARRATASPTERRILHRNIRNARTARTLRGSSRRRGRARGVRTRSARSARDALAGRRRDRATNENGRARRPFCGAEGPMAPVSAPLPRSSRRSRPGSAALPAGRGPPARSRRSSPRRRRPR